MNLESAPDMERTAGDPMSIEQARKAVGRNIPELNELRRLMVEVVDEINKPEK